MPAWGSACPAHAVDTRGSVNLFTTCHLPVLHVLTLSAHSVLHRALGRCGFKLCSARPAHPPTLSGCRSALLSARDVVSAPCPPGFNGRAGPLRLLAESGPGPPCPVPVVGRKSGCGQSPPVVGGDCIARVGLGGGQATLPPAGSGGRGTAVDLATGLVSRPGGPPGGQQGRPLGATVCWLARPLPWPRGSHPLRLAVPSWGPSLVSPASAGDVRGSQVGANPCKSVSPGDVPVTAGAPQVRAPAFVVPVFTGSREA